jgi:DNA-binding MarR family transcriptional regulator
MNQQQVQDLNYFFETTFNKILAWEERALQKTNLQRLTVKEAHIIEACKTLEEQNHNTMSHVASKLSITQGALTTAVNTLVRKGYLKRGSNPHDGRIVYIFLTEKGLVAYQKHKTFHNEMIKQVGDQLDEESLTTLTDSLKKLSIFFEQYDK